MIDYSKPVRVAFNLHKRQYSIRQGGKVVDYRYALTLYNAKPVVSEAGRQRVLRERKKNLHAFLDGYLVEQPPFLVYGRAVSYNPYKSGNFEFKDTGYPMTRADWVELFTAQGKAKMLAYSTDRILSEAFDR